MTRMAVLGGTRFIGFHLVQRLLRTGFEVTLFNRGRTTPPESFATPGQGGRLVAIQGHRENLADLERLFERGFDVVFDVSGYTRAQVTPVLERHRKQIGHYIFCSSSSVYQQPFPSPLLENAPRDFSGGTYGGEKALVEDMLLDSWRQHAFPTTVLRAHGVFGSHDGGTPGIVLSQLLHREPVAIRARCKTRTRFLDVQDLVEAFLLAAQNPLSHGKAYNVAGEETVSAARLANLCGDAAGRPPHIIETAESGLKWLDYELIPDNTCIKP
ncbi:MAG: NAD-dependent epimerase/dehydratase family protein [Deltaproteobacteria bacterium]|nr:NAD-dependent epimerase/dehydratase family protein [Deltaproteobacteria bacterium]